MPFEAEAASESVAFLYPTDHSVRGRGGIRVSRFTVSDRPCRYKQSQNILCECLLTSRPSAGSCDGIRQTMPFEAETTSESVGLLYPTDHAVRDRDGIRVSGLYCIRQTCCSRQRQHPSQWLYCIRLTMPFEVEAASESEALLYRQV